MDLWSYLYHNRSSFYNPFYLSPYEEDTTTLITFLPPVSEILRNVTLWSDYYFRWSAVPTLVVPPDELLFSLVDEAG